MINPRMGLLATLLALPVLLGAAEPDRQATGAEQTETAPPRDQGDELVDCRDYRGALRRVGDRCVRPIGVRTIYTRADLNRTGPLGTAEALRRLDPRIR